MSSKDYSFLKNCGNFELVSRLRMACETNDIETTKYILNETNCEKNSSHALVTACLNGFLELSDFLINSDELKIKADVNYAKALAFRSACSSGNLELVKLLKPLVTFTLPEFNENVASLSIRSACSSSLEITKLLLHDKYIFNLAEIKQNGIDWLFSACENGQFEIVKYLLTSKDLEKNVVMEPNSSYESYLYVCFRDNYLDIAKYLLASPDLSVHANINTDNDQIFSILCETESMDMLQWLIFDLGMKKTEIIDNYLKENPNEKISNWFKLRDINDELKKELNQNSTIKNRIKL